MPTILTWFSCKKLVRNMFYTLTILLIRLSLISAQYSERRPTVRLEQGLLTGFKITGETFRIDAFFGVPYAAPPINSLRFTPPQKHLGWNGTLDASNHPPPCPQLPMLENQNEDCLYLNIWVPEYWHRYIPKPVVIFFEGSDFSSSNRIPVSGQDLAMEDIVVVTVNYRLNIFGFFCLGTSDARGNLGLLDQYLAILWVKQNIGSFGGNPEKITLFGYSAGAASAVLHLTSPRTNGLFQRVILSSGSPTSPWHISNNTVGASRRFAAMLKCNSEEARAVLKCMRGKSTYEIMQTYQDYLKITDFESFLPVVDDFLAESDRYLPNNPIKSLKDGTYTQIPIMAGVSKIVSHSESKRWIALAEQGYLQLKQYIERVKLPEIMRRYNLDGFNQIEVTDLLRWKYITPGQTNANMLLKLLHRLEFDSKIEAPHYSFLNHLESTYIEPIYAYDFENFNLDLNTTDLTITADLILLFGPLLLNQITRRQFTPNELALSKSFKEKIKNFVNSGNPTPQKVDNWRRYVLNDYYVEYINETTLDMEGEILARNRRVSFWTQLLPRVAQMGNSFKNIYSKELLSPDPAASFRHAMYTLIGLVIALLVLLAICIFLLKKSYKERERHLHMIY